MKSPQRFLLIALVLGVVAAPLLAQDAPPPAAPRSPAPMATHAPRPNTYGSSVESKFLVPATAFVPSDSSTTYTGLVQRFSTNGGVLYAPLHLPSGAKIVSLELAYFDSTATDAEYGRLFVCDYLGTSCASYPSAGDGPGDCNAPGLICSGTANAPGSGAFLDTLIANDNITINNNNNQYLLYAANGTVVGSTAVASMIVGYIPQVSPAPGAPTFGDVPTSDPAYQFIEAFVAAGITVGCQNPGDPLIYCPDANVTRRQMAVFFAKALGLQFE